MFTAEMAQKRIRATMMARFIRNSLLEPVKRKLDQSRRNFQFKNFDSRIIEEDGPIMLKIIYDRINPSTRVGVNLLKTKLDTMKVSDFCKKVPDMIDAFDGTYNEILSKQGQYKNNAQALFDALMTTENSEFKFSITTKLWLWEKDKICHLKN